MNSVRNYLTVIYLCLLLPAAAGLQAQPTPLPPSGVETLSEYFDMLASGNLETARQFWTPSAQERSSRFGISYDRVPLKIDATSPIVRNLEVMADYLHRPVKAMDRFEDGRYSRMTYGSVVKGNLVEHTYWAMKGGEHYWLCYPQDYYARDWEIIESRYFRIHAHPGVRRYLNKVALEDADRNIERLAELLKLDDERSELIAKHKIEYFYCDSDSTVKEITGHLTKGTTDLASNDIISAFFPHYHEIARLLTNIKLRRLSFHTLPIMREGIAVHFGGRWGKAPTALTGLGGFLFKEKFIELDSILTMADFERNAQADIAYPVAGMLTGYLLEELGWNDYETLYRKLSGDFDSLYMLGRIPIQKTLVEATGKSSWEALVADFTEHIEVVLSGQAAMAPGTISDGKDLLNNNQVVVKANDDWLAFEFRGGDREPRGNLLFGYNEQLLGAHSLAFDDQYDEKVDLGGYRFGVRYDTNEAGLYDYVSNQLVAKYIWGITPSEAYYDKAAKRIAVKVRKELLGDVYPAEDDHKLLSN